jgi:polysaccharide pyruvyl transferase WcaK-like protein
MRRSEFIEKSLVLGTGLGLLPHLSFPQKNTKLIPKRILIYSGWQTINIGDIGHTPGALRYLYEAFPDAIITLWVAKYNAEIIKTLQARFPKLIIIKGNSKEISSEIHNAFENTDLFIYNSGMIFNKFWALPKHILELSINKKVPYILLGQSFDGFADSDLLEMKNLMSKSSGIYCRDTESLYYLRSLHFNYKKLEFGPDACFGIDLRDDKNAEAFLRKNKLLPKKYVTITLRTNTPKRNTGEDNVLNPQKVSYEDQHQTDVWAEKLRDLITKIVNDYGLKVLLAPEVEKEIEHAKSYLLDKLPPSVQKYVVWISEFWNLPIAASIYHNAHTVISMEPHSCIIAIANNTPILHLYSLRHGIKAWMFRDIGIPEWLFDIDKSHSDEIMKAFKNIHDNYSNSVNRVKASKKFVDERMRGILTELKESL